MKKRNFYFENEVKKEAGEIISNRLREYLEQGYWIIAAPFSYRTATQNTVWGSDTCQRISPIVTITNGTKTLMFAYYERHNISETAWGAGLFDDVTKDMNMISCLSDYINIWTGKILFFRNRRDADAFWENKKAVRDERTRREFMMGSTKKQNLLAKTPAMDEYIRQHISTKWGFKKATPENFVRAYVDRNKWGRGNSLEFRFEFNINGKIKTYCVNFEEHPCWNNGKTEWRWRKVTN